MYLYSLKFGYGDIEIILCETMLRNIFLQHEVKWPIAFRWLEEVVLLSYLKYLMNFCSYVLKEMQRYCSSYCFVKEESLSSLSGAPF